MNIVKQSVELLWHTPGMEYQIEVAGRTCYKSEDKINNESSGKFAEQMRKRGHHAMLEHAVASFRIITDRGISHEIVRHRLASYARKAPDIATTPVISSARNVLSFSPLEYMVLCFPNGFRLARNPKTAILE